MRRTGVLGFQGPQTRVVECGSASGPSSLDHDQPAPCQTRQISHIDLSNATDVSLCWPLLKLQSCVGSKPLGTGPGMNEDRTRDHDPCMVQQSQGHSGRCMGRISGKYICQGNNITMLVLSHAELVMKRSLSGDREVCP